MCTVKEVAACMTGAAVFSCIDASSGYRKSPPDEESCSLRSYYTPFGRYRYFGISSTSEIWQLAQHGGKAREYQRN